MPSTTVGPVEANDPPLAAIPFTVVNLRTASKSQMILPVFTSYARMWPSIEGAKTAPGITVGGDFWAGEHPRCPVQVSFGAGVFHTTFPVAGSRAKSPPPLVGSP